MDREVRIAFIAKTSQFTRDMKDMVSRIQEVRTKIDKVFDPVVKLAKNVGRTAIGMSSTLGAALGLSSKSALDFEKSMRNVNSILGASPAEFGKLEQQILHLASTVPKSAQDLADASYQIVSSGFTNAADLNLVLASSAKAATAGLTSTATAAQGITTVLQSYGLQAKDAAHVSDVLFQTVNVGMVNFDQLTGQMGDFLGISRSVGASLEETMGLYANMTLATGQYAQSATAMTGIMQGFINPSERMQQALLQIAPNGIKAKIASDGLTKTLYDLADGVEMDSTALHDFFPNVEGLRGVLALTRKPLADTQKGLSGFLNPLKLNGATAKVFKEQMKAVGNQLTQLHTAIGAAAISIGTVLMPFSFVVKGLTAVVSAFNDLPDPVKQATGLLLGLAAILGTVGGFIVVFTAKSILMGKAMQLLGLQSKSLTQLAIQKLGSEFTSKGKIIERTTGILSKATTGFSRLGTAGIPRATGALSGFAAKIPVVGTSVSLLTTSIGTKLGNAIGMVTTKSAGMGTGFSKIGTILGGMSRGVIRARDGFYSLLKAIPKLGAYATAAFVAFEGIKAVGDHLKHTEEKVRDLTLALADAARANLQPTGKEIKGLAQSIKDAGITDPGFVQGFYHVSDAIRDFFGSPLAGGGDKARQAVKNLGSEMKSLFDLDPKLAAISFEMYTNALKKAGVSQKEIDIIFKEYSTAVREAAVATGDLQQGQSQLDKETIDLAKHTMVLTAAQEKIKTGLGTWGDVAAALQEVKSNRQGLTEAEKADTAAVKANTKAHQEWLLGAEARNIAVEQSALSVARATTTLNQAQKAMEDLQRDNGHLARLKAATDAYTSALRANRDAHQAVIDAVKALDELQHPTPRTLQQAEDDYTRALNAQADAVDAVAVAQARYDESLLEGDPTLITRMNRELVNSQIDLRTASNSTADALKTLNDVRAGGDPETVAKLTQDVADAKDAETKATDDVTQAEKDKQAVEKEDPNAELEAATLTYKEAVLGLRSAVDGVTQAHRDLIEPAGEAVKAVSDFKKKTDDAKVSAKDLTDQLHADQKEQDLWLANIQKIAEKGPPGLAAALIQMGKDGAQVVNDLVTKTPEQLNIMFDAINTNAVTKTNEWAVAVLAGLTTGKNSAESVTQTMKENIAFQLGLSVGDVQRILDNFGKGVTPVLQTVKALIDDITTKKITGDLGNILANVVGNTATPGQFNPDPGTNLIGWIPITTSGPLGGTGATMSQGKGKAEGSFENHVAMIAQAGDWRLWAEPETGGESYIPHAVSKRGRSTDILAQTADLFGYKLLQFADGGMNMVRGSMVNVSDSGSSKPVHVEMPIHVEARVAAGVDMDYASRVIAQQVQAGVKMALDNLGRQVISKSWRR